MAFVPKRENPTDHDSVLGRFPEIPVGGRLKFFVDRWKLITDYQWVISTIRDGLKLEFLEISLFSRIKEIVVNAQNQNILQLGVKRNILEKGAIEPVPFQDSQRGFYSTFFLVPKKSGKLRPVINWLGARKTGLSPPYWPFQGGTSVVVPYCSCCLCLYFGSSIMLVTYFVNFR